MNTNAEILSNLINQDFGLISKEGSRWGKSEEHSSLVLDKERGIFYWNSEGVVGDPLVYLTKVRRLTFEDAKEYLKNFQYTGTHVYTINTKKGDIVVYPKLVDIFFEDGKNKRDYFYERGLTDDTINRFRLGFYNEFFLVPFFEDGTFRNFQMRKDKPKTIRSYYKGVGPILFNSDILKVVSTIYYTEGPIDAIVLMQNGLPAISSNSGGSFLMDWYSKFSNVKKIYLLFDNDNAGRNEAKRVAEILGTTRCKIYCFEDFEEAGYDPVDFFRDGYTTTELSNILNEKSLYTFQMEKINERNRNTSKFYGNRI